MSARDEIAEIIADAIRGGKESGSNFVGEWTHNDGTVRIDADVDLRVAADAIMKRFAIRALAKAKTTD